MNLGYHSNYLKEFDIAFIQNGNHSINLAYIFGQVALTTNEFFKYIEIKESFLDEKIYSATSTDNVFSQYIMPYHKDITLIWIAIQEYLLEKKGY